MSDMYDIWLYISSTGLVEMVKEMSDFMYTGQMENSGVHHERHWQATPE